MMSLQNDMYGTQARLLQDQEQSRNSNLLDLYKLQMDQRTQGQQNQLKGQSYLNSLSPTLQSAIAGEYVNVMRGPASRTGKVLDPVQQKYVNFTPAQFAESMVLA